MKTKIIWRFSRSKGKLLLLCLFLMLLNATAWAQYFGKNKVTQQKFEWFIHKTEHFDLYYYPGESRLALIMADIAEDAYRKYSEDFGHELSTRTPLILYKSHADFQETNIILQELTEGVGGFAELFKHRVVIPFTGSMTQFQEVIFHEITHIFQYDILYQKPVAHIYTGEFLYSPPIWFIEGMADYMAEDNDAVGEMVLRNATVSNSIVSLTRLQDFSPLGSQVFLGYKQGQSAIEYLAKTYGRDKLPDIMQELKHSRMKNLDDALKNTIGIDTAQFDKDWQRSIKRQYWPMIQYKKMPDEFATQLTGKKSMANSFKPVWSKSGELIAYITSEEGYDEIRIISAKDGKVIATTKKFHHSGYENIRAEGTGIDWSPDNDKLAFIARDKKTEYLFVLNIITQKIQKRIPLPFDASFSPTWAPDNNRIAFAALKDGQTDLYVISLDKGYIRQLTDDPFDDNHPNWHPVEDTLVYSSEREGKYKLFILDIENNTQTQLTYGQHNAVSPSWSPALIPPILGEAEFTPTETGSNGARIIFCSDLNGIYDLYIVDRDGNNFTRLTNTMTGCFNPSISPDGNKILLSAYHDGRQDIFVMNMDKAIDEHIDMPPLKQEPQAIAVAQTTENDRRVMRKKYATSLMLDAIFSDFQLSSDGLLRNTTQLIASDMMGNHRIGLSMANQTSFLTPDFIVSYVYLPRRTDYGIALFNFHEYHIRRNEFGNIIGTLQRNTGLLGFLSYPLDRYRRVELQTLIYSTPLEFKFDTNSLNTRGTIVTGEVSYIKDTTRWNEFGPYTGERYIFDVERSLPTLGSDLDMTNVVLDARKYFKIGKRSTFATRIMLGGSFGEDHEIFYLGGIDTLRGYDYEELRGTRMGLLNMEIRIPFIDELRFGWPFAWSIGGIRGILFSDFGTVWSETEFDADRRYRVFSRTGNQIRLKDVKGSIGVGLRLRLGFFTLDFDIARRTDFVEIGDDTEFHFGLGQEF